MSGVAHGADALTWEHEQARRQAGFTFAYATMVEWSGGRDSNPRPFAWEAF